MAAILYGGMPRGSPSPRLRAIGWRLACRRRPRPPTRPRRSRPIGPAPRRQKASSALPRKYRAWRHCRRMLRLEALPKTPSRAMAPRRQPNPLICRCLGGPLRLRSLQPRRRRQHRRPTRPTRHRPGGSCLARVSRKRRYPRGRMEWPGRTWSPDASRRAAHVLPSSPTMCRHPAGIQGARAIRW